MNKIACGATRKAPMKTVPVFGGNGVNSRRNQVIIMRLPPGGSCHEVTEGECGTDNFSFLPKACGCVFCFDYKIQRLKFPVTRSPSDGFAATFLPEEGILTTQFSL